MEVSEAKNAERDEIVIGNVEKTQMNRTAEVARIYSNESTQKKIGPQESK